LRWFYGEFENAKGGDFNDYIVGNPLANNIVSLGGNDQILGNGGNDTIDGGSGIDIAFFRGLYRDYSIKFGSKNGDAIVSDSVNLRDGVDQLFNVEYLSFADVTVRNGNFGADSTGPVPTSIIGLFDDKAVLPGDSIVIVFDEIIKSGSGKVWIQDRAGNLVYSYSPSSPSITSYQTYLILDIPIILDRSKAYQLVFDHGAVYDLSGNPSKSTSFAFSTMSNTDDFGQTFATSGQLLLNQPGRGVIDHANDIDWFNFDLDAGKAYIFTVKGVDSYGGSLANPTLALATSTGAVIQSNDQGFGIVQWIGEDENNESRDDRIEFVPKVSGKYVLGVRSNEESMLGSYAVLVQDSRSFSGTSFSEVLEGDAFDNEIRGAGGDDILDGKAGIDTAVFDLNLRTNSKFNYQIKVDRVSKTATVTNLVSSLNEEVHLIGIEKVSFGGQYFDLFNPLLDAAPKYGKVSPFLFDSAFYLLSNPNLSSELNGLTSFEHYLKSGATKGLKPNAWFDSSYYSNRWADLKMANLDPGTLFLHYSLYGVWEGRSAGPLFNDFDGTRYLIENPDVNYYVETRVEDFLGSKKNGAIAHYVIYGANEGRNAFDVNGVELNAEVVLIGVAG
jgi:Ca2+-binding RTX toxin-like protein